MCYSLHGITNMQWLVQTQLLQKYPPWLQFICIDVTLSITEPTKRPWKYKNWVSFVDLGTLTTIWKNDQNLVKRLIVSILLHVAECCDIKGVWQKENRQFRNAMLWGRMFRTLWKSEKEERTSRSYISSKSKKEWVSL